MPGANILIVEDSAPDAMLLRIALDEAGLDYNVTALRDGARAVEYVRRQSEIAAPDIPDMILLDINVPQVSGLEILLEIRAAQRFAAVPVLVLSSSQSPRDQSAIQRVQHTRFEIKPLDLDGYLELGRTIRKMLTSRTDARSPATLNNTNRLMSAD
jgi:CheY-like chemotaxis protein